MRSMDEKLARARSRSVMICTPIYDRPAHQYCFSLLETGIWLDRMGISFDYRTVVGNSNIARARNELAAMFLISNCTDLVFIDADMGWTASDVGRLLASEHDLIGAVGRKRSILPIEDPRGWCMKIHPDHARNGIIQDRDGAVQVIGVGTGFLKISRACFEGLMAAHPEWHKPGPGDLPESARDHYWRFFRQGNDQDEIGEDYGFCNAWREIGETVWIEPDIELVHVGEIEHRGHVGVLFTPLEKDIAA